MLLGRIAKWLGIYLLCNLITVLAFCLAWVTFAPKPNNEYITRVSSISMQDSFAGDLFRASYKVECEPPELEHEARLVTCAVVNKNGAVAAKTTYVFGLTDGSVYGHEDRDLNK